MAYMRVLDTIRDETKTNCETMQEGLEHALAQIDKLPAKEARILAKELTSDYWSTIWGNWVRRNTEAKVKKLARRTPAPTPQSAPQKFLDEFIIFDDVWDRDFIYEEGKSVRWRDATLAHLEACVAYRRRKAEEFLSAVVDPDSSLNRAIAILSREEVQDSGLLTLAQVRNFYSRKARKKAA